MWARLRAATWRRRRGLAASLLSALILTSTLTIANWYMAQDARLGIVHFPTSCLQSQRSFTTATALLHLFQFADAEEVYTSIARRDPDCAMAYWGIAMSRLRNPLYERPTPEDVAVARQALSAGAAARSANERERAYLAAVAVLFDPAPALDWHLRDVAYARAMERVAARYPDDKEATIFYALALNAAAAPADKTKADRTRAAELLLWVFAEQPDHPGIEHYLTYCLGNAGYKPKPFARDQMANPPQRLLLGAFALIALCGLGAFVALTSDLRPGAGGAAPIGGPFALTASDGSVVTDRTFRGHWMVVYFGYTHCPDVCPTTLLALAQALEKLGPLAADVRPIFVTIDPERDTPEIMGEFTKAFDSRIIGLTGSLGEIGAVARQYRVFFKKVVPSDGRDYFMDHSSYIFVMGPDGRYVTLFTHDQTEVPEEMAACLRELLNASPSRDERKTSDAIGAPVAAYSKAT